MYVKKIKTSGIWYKVLYSVLCVALGWYLHSKFTPDMSAFMHNNEPPHVLVKGLKIADVSHKKKYIAHVEAINSVDIMPQVSGYLEDILFEDGAFVNKGDDIFLIEQRKYKADLKAAQAAVKQLNSDYKRISSLHQKKFVSDKELDMAESNLEQAEAALDLAKLNLEYTQIKSPISGFIGKALVTKGNLVSPNALKLARIVQSQPIRVVFSVTDKELSSFMQQANDAKDVFVDVVMPNGKIETVNVENLFFGNEANPQTATIPVYIDLGNEENLLVPGNYVDINIRFNSGDNKVLVPQVALSADINGSYVMIVKEDNSVEQKYLELGDVVEDMQIVLNGLNGTEKVIIQGLQKVQAGMKVNPTEVNLNDSIN
ncbi:MAG: efflux RND transporter periplasmic adaptor subunit [Alphaproteobacteria bacterium]|nr:efflux RND transporter periplasmic adaptor subunit [Alphaproteobacteria bacterium]